MIGTLDSQVIEKFEEFQNKTDKYLDLNIKNIKFKQSFLKNLHQKEKVKIQKNTTANKFIEIGDINRETKKYDISNKVKPNLPLKGKYAPKGTILVSRVRPLLGGYTIIDGDDYTFTSGDLNPIVLPEYIDTNYIFIIICSPKFKTFLKKNQNTSGQKPTITDKLYDFDVPIPENYNDKYKSIDIQKIIVEFLQYSFDNLEQIKKNIDKRYEIVSKMKESLIPSTFKKIAIKNTFSKYAKENNINFDITDIEFENSTLGNVIVLNGGDRITKKNNSGTIYPVYGGGDVSFKTDTYNRENEYVIGRFAISETCVRFVNKKFHLLDSGFTFNIKDNFEGILDKNFVGYFLLSIQHKIYACAKGSGQKNLDTKLFNKIEFSFPKDENIQSLLVEFWEMILNNMNERFTKFDNIERLTNKVDEAFLYRTFSKIEWREE